MSRAVLNGWEIHEFAPGLYPERMDPEPGKVDQFLSGLKGRWARPTSALRVVFARRFAARVLSFESRLANQDETQLLAELATLRGAFSRHGMTGANAARAFALVREVCFRRLAKRHYPVQIMGGYTLLNGGLAEMMTGEGKTLTAVLPAVTVALAGIPVHVITVNEYLAKRDSEHMAPVFAFFGLSVGLIQPNQEAPERTRAYACDVTYCVNKDLVFDYLRDRITQKKIKAGSRAKLETWLSAECMDTPSVLLRGLYYAIVDEADSVLIDEARTPLIISAEKDDPNGRVLYEQALALARVLKPEHFRIHPKERSVELTDSGLAEVADFAEGLTGIWQLSRAREELVSKALSALLLYDLDRHYIVSEEKIQIVDEYTGRVMADRSWEGGLHQMIEVKEGLDLTKRRDTISRITYQRFFSRYLRLAGMSGTAMEVAPEFSKVFGLSVLRIPPNRSVLRKNLGLKVFAESDRRWNEVLASAKRMSAEGRAVLIGTRSVAASELISQRLFAAGLPHEVLNARQDAREAEIIAAAGQTGRITVATNMAGRGTDILLEPEVRARGGLHVILTEYHDSARIDRQLYGRSGRQGDPGSFEALVSIDDELFHAHASRWLPYLRYFIFSDGLLFGPIAHLMVWTAQGGAERQNAKIRQQTVKMDKRMEHALAFSGRGE